MFTCRALFTCQSLAWSPVYCRVVVDRVWCRRVWLARRRDGILESRGVFNRHDGRSLAAPTSMSRWHHPAPPPLPPHAASRPAATCKGHADPLTTFDHPASHTRAHPCLVDLSVSLPVPTCAPSPRCYVHVMFHVQHKGFGFIQYAQETVARTVIEVGCFSFPSPVSCLVHECVVVSYSS